MKLLSIIISCGLEVSALVRLHERELGVRPIIKNGNVTKTI